MSIPLICDNCKKVYPKGDNGSLLIPEFARKDDEILHINLCSSKCLYEYAKFQFEFEEQKLKRKTRRKA